MITELQEKFLTDSDLLNFLYTRNFSQNINIIINADLISFKINPEKFKKYEPVIINCRMSDDIESLFIIMLINDKDSKIKVIYTRKTLSFAYQLFKSLILFEVNNYEELPNF